MSTWWRHQMETFSALPPLCVGNPPVTAGFPSQRPMTRSFETFFGLHLNKRLSEHSSRHAHYDVTVMHWSFVRECTGHRWIPPTKASHAVLWFFLWSGLNKRFNKQSRRRWFETPSRSLWRHRNDIWIVPIGEINPRCFSKPHPQDDDKPRRMVKHVGVWNKLSEWNRQPSWTVLIE